MILGTVAGDGDGAVKVGAKDAHVVLVESGEYTGMRMPIGIARPRRNNAHFGLHPLNKVGVRRRPAAVVRHLQDVGTEVADMRG